MYDYTLQVKKPEEDAGKNKLATIFMTTTDLLTETDKEDISPIRISHVLDLKTGEKTPVCHLVDNVGMIDFLYLNRDLIGLHRILLVKSLEAISLSLAFQAEYVSVDAYKGLLDSIDSATNSDVQTDKVDVMEGE